MNPSEITISTDPSHEVLSDYRSILEEMNVRGEVAQLAIPENQEISAHYACLDEIWIRNEIIIDDVFVFLLATEIMKSDDIKPCFVDECQCRIDWSK